MKKSGFLLLVLAIAFSSCGGGSSSNGGGGNSGGGESSGIIDVSNTGNCIYPNAFSFGYKNNDQAKRFQTFIADCHTKLDGVEVKIKKNNGTQTYNNVSVELYDTKTGLPSNKLAETTIGIASVGTESAVIRAELKYLNLVPGAEYAIVLGQVNLDDTTAGFEWCTYEVNSELNFGKLEGSTWIDEFGLGDGWLKVYVSGSLCSTLTKPYYTGTITVVSEDTVANCTHTYDNHATFNILLENVPSFPSTDGMEWRNSQAVSITGSILETTSGSCFGAYDLLTSNGPQAVTPSASTFPVTLILWNSNKYALVVSTIAFPNCTYQMGSLSGTVAGMIIVPYIEVIPIPADPSHLIGETTVTVPLADNDVKVSWDLKRID
ncbi:MAG: hypothetical protein V1874_14740 [Spirochaetota bacterium]